MTDETADALRRRVLELAKRPQRWLDANTITIIVKMGASTDETMRAVSCDSLAMLVRDLKDLAADIGEYR